MSDYEDILFEKEEGIVTITLNRPQVLNAFRPKTVEELIQAFERAGGDPVVGVIILTGAGERKRTGGNVRR